MALAKMEFRPPSTESNRLPEEAIFGVSSMMHEPPYIKIASHTGGRDGSDPPTAERNHFRGPPFPFCPFSFGRAKENGQPSSDICSLRFGYNIWVLERTDKKGSGDLRVLGLGGLSEGPLRGGVASLETWTKSRFGGNSRSNLSWIRVFHLQDRGSRPRL